MPNSPVLDAVLTYISQGWSVTPVLSSTKAPKLSDWLDQNITADNAADLFAPSDNIGLLMGPASGGLVCVDLDHPIAVRVADDVLPYTGMVEGREGKPRSHRFYRMSEIPENKSIRMSDRSTLMDLISANKQIVVPPSVHPSGEIRKWHEFGVATVISREDMHHYLAAMSVICELVRIWPSGKATGVRHDATMALAGGLHRAGWTAEQIYHTVEILCRESGDNELADRQKAVESTLVRMQDRQLKVTGWNTLLQLTDDERAILHILGLLGRDPDIELDDRPAVEMAVGHLDRVLKRIWEGIIDTNDPPLLFRQSNQIVRANRIDDSDQMIIHVMNRHNMMIELVERLRWYQVKNKSDIIVHVPSAPTLAIADLVLAEENPDLPILNRITGVPVFGPDGELQLEPGYHPDSRTFYQPSAELKVEDIPEDPTTKQIEDARAWLLDELLVDFPFEQDSDRAHAVAMILLPFVRDMIDGPTPMHMIEAPTPGTGKGKLATVSSMIYAGRGVAQPTSGPTQEEEWRKKLFSLLIEGHGFVWIDNISNKLDSASLASCLTSTVYTDRLLGSSASMSAPNRAVWLATANNPSVSDEIARRMVRIRLVSGVEMPFLRDPDIFRHPDLEQWTLEHRNQLVTACLVLVQAWIAKGRPQWVNHRLGSFENWSRVMGGILEVVGIDGFLGNIKEHIQIVATDSMAWRDFMHSWWERFGDELVPVKDLVDLAVGAGIEVSGNTLISQTTSLGMQLARHADMVFDELRLSKAKKTKKANCYQITAPSHVERPEHPQIPQLVTSPAALPKITIRPS